MDQSTDTRARGGSRNRLVAILPACGIVVAVRYVAGDVVAAARQPGYRFPSCDGADLAFPDSDGPRWAGQPRLGGGRLPLAGAHAA